MKTINKLLTGYNHNAGNASRIKYIVIHYVGALGGATENCQYYAGGNRNASAHYFVGFDGAIWQSVEDANIAWHCGANTYKHAECRNANSIGIEMCVRKKNTASLGANDKDWYFEDATVESAAELTRYLMEKYNVPASNVIRHYDVTGKVCPNPYVYNTTGHTWEEFKNKVSSGSTASETSTEKTIWDFLISKGLNTCAAAGVMGNLHAESGLNACNLQNTYNTKLGMNDTEYTAAVDNGSYKNFVKDSAGYGLAQWTYYTRKQALLDCAKAAGASIGNLNMQLSFLWQELQGYKSVMAALKGAGTVQAASDAVLTGYEKPADQSEAVKKKRAEYGVIYYNKYAGDRSGSQAEVKAAEIKTPYKVKVDTLDLRIRTGAGTNYAATGEYTGKGTFTITEEKEGKGSVKGWGKLKSGAGWIALDYCTKI
ncbi:phage tail tip lysozyme [Konateibacter massiliensis]|uniref:phage tail tip lysozyme n=1 Tax=Konateibacter massiliensis TaxID=2002841 RepID=UPI000C14D354|nr:phage tail tip lysozyme [Konateibacter massiliensis]